MKSARLKTLGFVVGILLVVGGGILVGWRMLDNHNVESEAKTGQNEIRDKVTEKTRGRSDNSTRGTDQHELGDQAEENTSKDNSASDQVGFVRRQRSEAAINYASYADLGSVQRSATEVSLVNEKNSQISVEVGEAEKKEAERLEAERKAEEERIKALMEGVSGSQIAIDNTYPMRDNCPLESEMTMLLVVNEIKLDGVVCQCTSYASWKVYERYGYAIDGWGDARNWTKRAVQEGKVVNNVPAAHTVGQIDNTLYGHVFWVESINMDGSLNVSEYNNSYSTYLYTGEYRLEDFGAQVIPAEAVGNFKYIHFEN